MFHCPTYTCTCKINVFQGKHSGVLVTKVSKLGAASRGGVKDNDVILSIDGCSIQNDGTIDFRQDERLAFIHKVGSRIIGESMTLEVLRDSKVRDFVARFLPFWRF